MMTWSVERKTLIGLLVALLTLAVSATLAIRAIEEREDSSARLSQAQQRLLLISELHADINEVAVTQDTFVSTGIRAVLDDKAHAISRLNNTFDEAARAFRVTPQQQQRFMQARTLIQVEIDTLAEALDQYTRGGMTAYVGSELRVRAQVTMNAVNQVLGAMVGSEKELIAHIQTLDRRSAHNLYWLQGCVLAVAMGVLLWLALHIRSDLRARRYSEHLLRQTNAELENKAHLLKLSNQDLEGFCYSVSHDLRAPLRTIDGFAQLLKDDFERTLSSEGLRHIQTIRNASKRMAELIDDLLSYAKMGQQAVNSIELDMTELANRAAEIAVHGYANKPLIDIEPLPPAFGDESMLYSVWLNLIDNAIKYSGKAQQAEVRVRSFIDGDQHVYSVRDNGVGFDMSYYDKLFGMFQRLHSNNEFPGTGVGLAIVNRIVTRHGGRVWAESSPDAGATFYFSLPRRPSLQLEAAA